MKIDVTSEEPLAELAEFADEFYQDRLQELIEIKTRLNNLDFEAARKTSHKWKGFASPYGFTGLEILGKKLEIASEQKDLAMSQKLIQDIEGYMQEKAKFMGL